MNRAAEAAVPEAQALLVNSVKQMSVTNAKYILTRADDAATQYFKKTTSAPMAEKFLPIVKKTMEDVKLAQQCDKFAATAIGKASAHDNMGFSISFGAPGYYVAPPPLRYYAPPPMAC